MRCNVDFKKACSLNCIFSLLTHSADCLLLTSDFISIVVSTSLCDVSFSPSHSSRFLSLIHQFVGLFQTRSCCISLLSAIFLLPSRGVCLSCTYCRLALDDAIRHKQLNISRFSPRVAGENDFLQTVINKVITAKEVNHKGQGKVESRHRRCPQLHAIVCIGYTIWPLNIRAFATTRNLYVETNFPFREK